MDNLRAMMAEMDKSGTGKVTFEEWRDYLLVSAVSVAWTDWSARFE